MLYEIINQQEDDHIYLKELYLKFLAGWVRVRITRLNYFKFFKIHIYIKNFKIKN